MAKYNSYIELRPGYESVVDIGSEERNPNLWQEYIVHEDMKVAIEKSVKVSKWKILIKDVLSGFMEHMVQERAMLQLYLNTYLQIPLLILRISLIGKKR